ncbi:unnamed protein product, partial [Didymodactylos carnosus]
QTLLTYYRGQLMSSTEIDQFKQHIQSLISINTFFSTTSLLDIALMFAGGSSLEGITTNKPVIFSIEINSFTGNTRPYANVNFYQHPIYALVGLNGLFKVNEQREQIKSILEGFDVQFFDNTDDLDAHTKLIRAIQSFVIFIDNRLYIPERYQQFRTYRVDFRSIFKDDFNIFCRTK